MFIEKENLAETVDNINDALFWDRKISEKDRSLLSKWLSDRQGLPGSYRGLFAPFPSDFRTGFRLFTGEWVKTGAGTAHVLGEEVSQILHKLNPREKSVQNLLSKANQNMVELLEQSLPEDAGVFCCGTCSVAMWRNLAAGGLNNTEARIIKGITELKHFRTTDGKYRRFPYYYTLLALSEIDLPLVKEEIVYLAPKMESYLKRSIKTDKYVERKREIMFRLLRRI